jgi:hypothetical protein
MSLKLSSMLLEGSKLVICISGMRRRGLIMTSLEVGLLVMYELDSAKWITTTTTIGLECFEKERTMVDRVIA